MKLVVDDDKDTSCNGNGVLVIDDQIKKMISSEPPKVSSNGDVHNDDSRSNSDSLNGSGDLLIEDPNSVRNGEDTTFQNGNKLDDTRSWSSNSSNFPPPDIDEDLSDEMTLRLSDEEDESENTPESTENKNNSTRHTSSPLLKADQNTLSDKNQLNKLVENDKLLDKSSTIDNAESNTDQKQSDNLSNKEKTTKTGETEKSLELVSLMSDTSDTSAIDTDKDKSVTELREEMEELLNDDDSEDKAPIDFKDEALSDTELNSSSSTLNISFTNEESFSDLNKETEIVSICIKEEEQITTTDSINKEKTNENKEIERNNDEIETEDISKLVKEVEDPAIKSNENNEESHKDAPAVSTENSKETISDEIGDKSDSVSDNISEESKNDECKTNAETTVNDVLKTNLKDNDENNKKSNDETKTISEPMVIESDCELKSSVNTSNDSEPMEVDSNDIEKITDTIVEQPTKNNSLTEINEEKQNDALVDSKDTSATKENEELNSELEVRADIKEEVIKDKKDEESTNSLKRSLEDVNEVEAKKPKIALKPEQRREYVPLNYLRDFLSKKEVKTMSREELEEFCVQKMCESINQTSKVGELNRLVKQQEQVIESLRTKYNGLKKQIGDISIVQNKMLQEVRSAKVKDGTTNVMPVKITRSVGLQVSLQPATNRGRPVPSSPEQLVAAAPMQKRKLQRISLPNKLLNAQTPVTPITPAKPVSATIPKSPNVVSTPTLVSATTPTPSPVSAPNKIVKTILPRTFNGPDTNKDVTSSTNSLLGTYLTNTVPRAPTPNITRKTITPTNAVSSSATTPTANSAKVIDLTDEDDVSKTSSAIPQTPAGIRVVAPHQLNNTSTTVTSQMQRVTYLVSPGQQGQVLLATTSAPTRPGGPRSTIMFKPVQQGQVQNGQRLNFVRPHSSGGTVTVLPATSTASIRPGQQIRFQTSGTTVNSVRPQMISSTRITPTQRHPAPLPGPPAVQSSQPTWKAMPPKPSLKISRVGDGIVLSWKMLNKDMSLYEDIASYQLYAYQETNALPSTDMWRKVGDVKALALPMACTLTQFTDGNKYHFAVRAVDVKSRVGPFSQPEQIALP